MSLRINRLWKRLRELKKENEGLCEENQRLYEENQRLKEELERVKEEYAEYKLRHPKEVGVKHGKATVFVRTEHVPRQIDRIKFKLNTDLPVGVILPPESQGGLCGGWQITQDDQGYYNLWSDTPIEFGNFGILFALNFSGLPVPVFP